MSMTASRSREAGERWIKGGRAVIAALLGAITMCAGMARGQCEAGWDVGVTDGLPDFDDEVFATLNWDPDGAGPEPEMMVFGGEFVNAGNRRNVTHIVGWDGARWIRFGAGLPSAIRALGTSNGRLVAAYSEGVAWWNGEQWVAMNTGLVSGPVGTLVEFEGVLYAAPLEWGWFEFAGGEFSAVGRWTGTSWEPVEGAPPWSVFDMTVWNGQLVLAGSFYGWVAGNYQRTGVLMWDRPSWVGVGTNAPELVTTLGQYNGQLLAGSADVFPNRVVGSVQRLDGQSWSALGGGIGENINVTSFAAWNGRVVAAGKVWDGSAWTSLPVPNLTGPAHWHALGDTLVVVGDDTWLPQPYRYGARLSGDRWTGFGGGPIGNNPETGEAARVRTMCIHEGCVLVAGTFQYAGAEPSVAIAAWTQGAWQRWGEPLDESSSIEKLIDVNGELLAQGSIVRDGGEYVGPIARWDGVRWRRLGDRYPWDAAITVHDGVVFACCDLDGEGYQLARWSGVEWETVSADRVDRITALVSFGGDLVALGYIGSVGDVEVQNAARWDGATWHAMGAELLGSATAALVHDGVLFVAGTEIIANWRHDVARWDGAAWRDASDGIQGTVMTLAEWNGSMVAGTSEGVFRWNGASWVKLAGIENDPFTTQRELNCLLGFGDSLLVGGAFWIPGDKLSPHFARWREPVAPSIGAGPVDVVVCRGGAAEFSVSASGSEPIAYQWRRGGAALVDGVTAGGSVVSGAATAALTVSGVSAADEGVYQCIASNACEHVVSAGAALVVCAADFDCNGFVNGEDFDAFTAFFDAGDQGADMDGDGFVNGDDFDGFMAAFAAGC